MYNQIRQQRTTRALYAEKLIAASVVTEEEAEFLNSLTARRSIPASM